jgi:hypothetical protein
MPVACQTAGLLRRKFLSLPLLLLCAFLLTELNAQSQNAYKKDFSFLRLNEVKASAVRHFVDNFSGASDIRWTCDEQYYIASFTDGHSRSKAYYKINGNFAFCLKYYQADALEDEVKSAVLNKFPNCEIIVVTEISALEKKAFYVNIVDGATIKTLLCNDEGIDVTETIQNAGI